MCLWYIQLGGQLVLSKGERVVDEGRVDSDYVAVGTIVRTLDSLNEMEMMEV